MNWKKVLLLMLALMLAFALVGCGDDAGTDASDGGADTTVSTDADDALKIAIVTSPSGVDDGSFNQNNYEGIQAFIANNPNATVTPIQEPDFANAVPAVEAIVADYDVIVTPGFQFGGITEIARANPDKYFILVDAFPADPDDPFGDPVVVDNIYAMQFAEQESGFFAGIAAAMQTETGKVAVVNGVAYPSNVNYQFGFMSGVNYANKNLGTKAELVEIASYAGTDVFDNNVGGNYIGDFNDPEGGKKVGEALLDLGVDVIFVAAGNSGNGVFTAVKEDGNAWVIGCDVNQFADGDNGDNNIVLTSGLKVMDLNVERQLNAIADGTFKGGNYTLFADSDSTGFVYTEGQHQLKPEVLEELKKAYEAVKSGTIVPAGQFTDTTFDDFLGL